MVLGIYGAGGLGREILELSYDINAQQRRWQNVIFIDDSGENNMVHGVNVLTFEQLKLCFKPALIQIAIAVGEPAARTLLREKVLSAGYELTTMVHPCAKVGMRTTLGDGTIIGYGCFISCNVKIGCNVCLQPISSIGHDSIINDDSVISSYVSIAGTCRIGEQTYIGMQVPVQEHITIGSRSIVGMGSVVQRDIPDDVIALGNPARAMKINENHRVFVLKRGETCC